MEPSDGLQSDLRTLLLEAFAEGETVSGVWYTETARDELPDWRVVIERVDSTQSDDPTEEDSS